MRARASNQTTDDITIIITILTMFTTPHFETGQYHHQHVFLPDDIYGQALDCLVKVPTNNPSHAICPIAPRSLTLHRRQGLHRSAVPTRGWLRASR